MFSKTADLDKPGIQHLQDTGSYAVIVNKEMYARDQAKKYAVVNVSRDWVNDVFDTRNEATSFMQELYQA